MPASMISAPSGLRLKVTGSSMAMVAIGPMPGNTPISVPIRHPNRQNTRLRGVAAAASPIPRLCRMSISEAPIPDRQRLAQQAHEQNGAQDGQADGENGRLDPPHLRACEGSDDSRDHDGGSKAKALDQ